MTLTYLTKDNYDEEITKAKTPVIIDFYADWCMPCKMMVPVFEAVSKDYQGKVKFVKLDTENQEELAQKFEVQSIPSLVIMNNGKEIDRLIGFMPRAVLKDKVDYILSSIKK